MPKKEEQRHRTTNKKKTDVEKATNNKKTLTSTKSAKKITKKKQTQQNKKVEQQNNINQQTKGVDEKITLAKIWDFLWNSNSIWSWIANFAIAFILIKFIVFPLLGIIFQTGLPVVAVISQSMHHDGNFEEWMQSNALCSNGSCTQEEWYTQKGISKEEFKEYPLSNGFSRGDIIIIKGDEPQDLQVGDIIVFDSGKNYPIIHRIISKNSNNGEYTFETKGDKNPTQIKDFQLDETNVEDQNIHGKAIGKIPYIGYIKIFFSELVNI